MISSDFSTSPAAPTGLVLIVSSNEWWCRSLMTVVTQAGHRGLTAFTAEQAEQLIAAVMPDAIIADLRMADAELGVWPGSLKRQGGVPDHVPIIGYSKAQLSRTRQLALTQSGVWHLVHDPIDGDLLMAQLRNALAAKRRADSALATALLDEQTGIYNIRGLSRRSTELAAEAHRRRAAVACIVLSIDQDVDSDADALRRIADAVRGASRGSDILGRVGPGEFAVIALLANAADEDLLVDRISAAVGGIAQMKAVYCTLPERGERSTDLIALTQRLARAVRQSRPDGADEPQHEGIRLRFVG
jgi:PleD family two-component response regulator